MNTDPFAIGFDDLPDVLPVFPLQSVLLLPRGQLPLNIFEPRYLAMVADALQGNRLIGIIQPRTNNALYQTGCAGRITSFSETDDGRYLITLKGVCRFHAGQEQDMAAGGYRRVIATWSGFSGDITPPQSLDIDRKKLSSLLASYFDMEGMKCDWAAIESASDEKLITCLTMACPLDAGEKQALLEAPCCKTRADLFMSLLEMAIRDPARDRPDCAGQCH